MIDVRLLTLPARLPIVLGICALLIACPGPHDADEGRPITVFAAASLQDLMLDAGAEWKASRGIDVSFSFAGSNTLAQQILAAPGADVFLSADSRWMDRVEAADRLVPGARADLFSNSLVVVARHDAELELEALGQLPDLPFRRLALGAPNAVPAGHYARAALESHGIWQSMRDRLVPTSDVRSAMALVAGDPEFVGIVYKTDALTSKKVRILLEISPADHPPIVYTAGAIADGPYPARARDFLDFLSGRQMATMVARHGFRPVPPTGP